MITPLKIGIDFGGVLSKHEKSRKTDDASEHRSISINMPGAIDGLRELKKANHKLYIISFCGKQRAIETKASLLQSNDIKGIFDGIYFVKDISYKVDICSLLGCDIMIDDRLDILESIHQKISTMKLIWLIPNNNIGFSNNVLRLDSWSSILKAVNEGIADPNIRHIPVFTFLKNKLHDV